MDPAQMYAQIRQVLGLHKQALDQINAAMVQSSGPKTLDDQINAIPGRRVFYTLVGSQTFTTSQDGARGNSINMTVSQDGPFVMTHYPFVLWRPSLPTNATNFGIWRSVNTAYLPTQSLTNDFINISYEIFDGGSDRALQNAAVPPIISQPYKMMNLPVKTIFAPNSTLQFVPTYNDINFNGTGTATTEGTLVVAMPGFRVVNL